MQRDLPSLTNLHGSPRYEVGREDRGWCWYVETATENWSMGDYPDEGSAVVGAWEHAAKHFGLEVVRRIEFRYLELPRDLLPLRRMSFFMTIAQVRARSKTVTRRAVATWRELAAGDRILAVEKGQGLRPGQRHMVLALLEVVDVRLELLTSIDEADCAREGFPQYSPTEFVAFFRRGGRPPRRGARAA